MDAAFQRSPRLQRRLVGAAFALGIATLVSGLAAYALDAGEPDQLGGFRALVNAVFNVTGLLFLNGPADPHPEHWLLDAARLLAVATATTGIAFVIVSLYRDGADWLKLRFLGWRAAGSHVVICGLGRVGNQLVQDLCSGEHGGPKEVVVVEIDPANSRVAECRNSGATVLIGDAREPDVRRRARLERAAEVFIVTGVDAVNLDIAEEVRSDLEGRAGLAGHVVQCFTNVLGHTLALAADGNLPLRATGGQTGTGVAFHIFNTDVTAARQLLLDDEWGLARRPPESQSARANRVPTGPDEVAYYIVFGFGPMGQTVALQMARLAHFPNLKRLRLTIVDRFDGDPTALRHRLEFLDRHPGFCPEALDLEQHILHASDPDGWGSREARPIKAWRIDEPEAVAVEYAVNAEFVDLPTGVDAPDLLDALLRRIQPAKKAARPCVGVIFCFEEDRDNFEAALRLQTALRTLHADGAIGESFPLYAYIADEQGLRDLLHRKRGDPLYPIQPFGLRDEVAGHPKITRIELRRMAKAVHEMYGGDTSWEELEAAMRASNEDAAAHGDIKLDALKWQAAPRGPADAPPTLPGPVPDDVAWMEHNRWMGERLAAGWRYGERRGEGDVGNRRRVAFRVWETLPPSEREKDVRQVEQLAGMYFAAGYVLKDCAAPVADAARDYTPSPAGGGTIR